MFKKVYLFGKYANNLIKFKYFPFARKKNFQPNPLLTKSLEKEIKYTQVVQAEIFEKELVNLL